MVISARINESDCTNHTGPFFGAFFFRVGAYSLLQAITIDIPRVEYLCYNVLRVKSGQRLATGVYIEIK